MVDYSGREKKFSKTVLVKKPFEAKKKMYQSMEQHLDAAIDKVVSLAKEPERMKEVDMVEPSMLGAVAEPEFQYGAEAFEAQYKELMSQIIKEPLEDAVIKSKKRYFKKSLKVKLFLRDFLKYKINYSIEIFRMDFSLLRAF